MSKCIQCEQEANDKYCANCGQEQDIPRLSFKTFFQDFFSRIYGLDGAMPRTIVRLTTNPGLVPKEYIKGVRKIYAGPVGYYFILFAVYLLLIQIYQVNMDEYSGSDDVRLGIQQVLGDEIPQEETALQANIKSLLYKNLQFMLVLALPLIAIWFKLFFRKSNYNILEGTVFAFYTQGHMVILNIIGLTFFAITGITIRGLTSIGGLLYFAIAGASFYTGTVSIKGVIKSTIAYIIAFISFIILILILASIIFKVHSIVT